MMPATRSRFWSSISLRAASSIMNVLPTPGAAPKKMVSLPRADCVSSSRTWARSSSGSGRPSTFMPPMYGVSWTGTRYGSGCEGRLSQALEREVQLEDVDPGLAQEAELAVQRVLGDKRPQPPLVDASNAGNALHLVGRRSGGDIGIEAAARRCDEVDGNRGLVARVRRLERVDA